MNYNRIDFSNGSQSWSWAVRLGRVHLALDVFRDCFDAGGDAWMVHPKLRYDRKWPK